MNCGVYSSFVYIFACLILIGHAAPKPYVMPDVTMEWGSGEAKVNCFKKEDLGIPNITRTNLYYTKCLGGENIVNRINGKVTYIGGSNESVQLNDDGSISLLGDYRSIGEYSCSYWRSTSFTETLTKVDIFEPPLRVLECNATTKPNQSQSTCQVNVPNGTRSLNFTAIKEGLQWPNRTISVVLPRDVTILTKTGNTTTTNADNSTTKSMGYELDVRNLTSSRTVSFVLDREQVHVLLNKAESFTSDSNLISGQIGGIALGVIAVAVLTYWSSSTCWLGQIGIVEQH